MLSLGIDIGATSIKCALVADGEEAQAVRASVLTNADFSELQNHEASETVVVSTYRRLHGNPREALRDLLVVLDRVVPASRIERAMLTGSGAYLMAKELGVPSVNEFSAVAQAVGRLHPAVRTVFEMGGENTKFVHIDSGGDSGGAGIADYEKNGDCAAGTGSFIDQQALRLQYAVEDVGELVVTADKPPTIAGRCSVFAKSDMIHAQQKGYRPPEILKGLCEAVARNFKGAITKGKDIRPPIAFIGGVAANAGVVEAMNTVFGLEEGDLFVPDSYAWIGAIGAAYLARADESMSGAEALSRLTRPPSGRQKLLPTMPRLSMDRVVALRDRIKPYSFDSKDMPVSVHLGIDIGSVSTNLVLIDDAGDLVYEVYTYTKSRPVEVVNAGLAEIRDAVGDRVVVRSVGTTGSGRELVGLLVGADTINDEITAHKTGATYVGERLIDTKPDTILEIGGQDSKFISLSGGVVTDFTMNDACAAGTGSFLEEQADKLGVRIKGEFAERALSADRPLQMGERCTVFMEKDVTSFLNQGAGVDEVCGGLAYSVALNYLNRVVRGRAIGENVFFQGGTAYNDAVAAAFSQILEKPIIIPPHNGVIGAIGMALLARQAVERRGRETGFRGWSTEEVDYTLREFTCKGCSNTCDMQQFTVEGEKTYWGDKCSDRYRKQAKTDHEPVIPDLVEARMEALLGDYEEPDITGRTRVGVPRAMYFFDWFPFWREYFRAIDVDVVVSDPSSKQIVNDGIDTVLAEPCFPVKVAHGHVRNLLGKQVDWLWQPSIIDAETEFPEVNSFLCPWGQTLPWVMRVAPKLANATGRWLHPVLHPREGAESLGREMWAVGKQLGASKAMHRRAMDAAYAAHRAFRATLIELGRESIETLHRSDELGIVLLGRPYNICDPGINLSVPSKLRTQYGINVIPMDLLPIKDIDISDVNDNMFWDYGRKILQAARFVSEEPRLRIMYITNFKCGPDSYIKTFAAVAAQAPYLTLQFDGHANDAGTMTRCEAYLDSQGFFTHEAGSEVQAAPRAAPVELEMVASS